MLDKKENMKMTEKLGFGMLLALVGGFIDVYSYIMRGKVFATGQTGNFVLAAAHLAEKDYSGMLHAIVPIVSFWIGTFIAWHMFFSISKESQQLWKYEILIAEILILFITGLIPCSYPNIIANTLLSFASSLQYCAFRKFGSSENYASIFCTGNMRSCADNYYKGIIRKDKQCLKRALHYSYILISFFIGVLLGSCEAKILNERAIWTAAVILSIAFALSFIWNEYALKSTVLINKKELLVRSK